MDELIFYYFVQKSVPLEVLLADQVGLIFEFCVSPVHHDLLRLLLER